MTPIEVLNGHIAHVPLDAFRQDEGKGNHVIWCRKCMEKVMGYNTELAGRAPDMAVASVVWHAREHLRVKPECSTKKGN